MFWHGAITKYTARYHCNNIAVTTTNTDTNAKANTFLHDNICGTKSINNDWSYPGNGTKCSTISATVLLVWSYLVNGTKCSIIAVTVLLLWSYLVNGTTCSTIAVTVLLLWSYPSNGDKCVSRESVYQSFLYRRSARKIPK